MMQSERCSQEGLRLDAFLAQTLPQMSRAQIKRCIEAGDVWVQDKICTKAAQKLHMGDEVRWEIEAPNPNPLPQPDPSIALSICFEDDAILVLNKPAGLVVHPGAGNPTGTLVQGVLAHAPSVASVGEPDRPGIVHRLDADTSGLLVVAKTQDAYSVLTGMFARHEVHRQYWALCEGAKLPDQGRWDTPYGRHPNARVKYSSKFDAEKRAITDYKVLLRAACGVALVTCTLQTGRTHQVRVHLSDHNAPILSDPLYAPKKWMKMKPMPRLALHAGKLSFQHPITQVPMAFTVPFPTDFQNAVHFYFGASCDVSP